MDTTYEFWIVVTALLLGGAALTWVGRMQRAGTLGRNWFVGLRTWKTLRSDRGWDAAHAATATPVTAAGITQLLMALVLVLVRPDEPGLITIVLGGLSITLVMLSMAAHRGHTIAARLGAQSPQKSDE